MAENQSVFDQAKRLEMYVLNILSDIDMDSLDRREQKLVATIKRQFADAKLDVRDHEYAETKAEQTKVAKVAVKSLEAVRASILTASEHNLFSAIDVAMLTAQLEQLVQALSN